MREESLNRTGTNTYRNNLVPDLLQTSHRSICYRSKGKFLVTQSYVPSTSNALWDLC